MTDTTCTKCGGPNPRGEGSRTPKVRKKEWRDLCPSCFAVAWIFMNYGVTIDKETIYELVKNKANTKPISDTQNNNTCSCCGDETRVGRSTLDGWILCPDCSHYYN